MTELAKRRRAIMAGSGRDSSIIYEIINRAVLTGDSIDTGIAPFTLGQDVSILLDYDQTYYEGASGAAGSLIKCMITTTSGNSKFALGKYGRSDSSIRHWWMAGNYTSISGTSNSAMRKRFIVTHQSNSGTLIIYVKTGTNALQTVQVNSAFTSSLQTLKFGDIQNGTGSLCAGTITMARIYNRILDQSEINDFFD